MDVFYIQWNHEWLKAMSLVRRTAEDCNLGKFNFFNHFVST